MEQEHKLGSEQHRKDSKKKSYTKPSFVSEKIYETVALACGKLPGQGGSCNSAPSRS
jgi:hypothetical protein